MRKKAAKKIRRIALENCPEDIVYKRFYRRMKRFFNEEGKDSRTKILGPVDQEV